MGQSILITVERQDVLKVEADVLALKLSDLARGADYAVIVELAKAGVGFVSAIAPGKFTLLKSQGATKADRVLFVGVPPLSRLGYGDIREWAHTTLRVLNESEDPVQTLAVTVHGPGFGLDTRESFLSEIAGFVDAVKAGNVPAKLRHIVVVERDEARFRKWQEHLEEALPSQKIDSPGETVYKTIEERAAAPQEDFKSYGVASDEKKSVFVAMPFAKEFRNTFDYGIEKPVQESGYLCERIDNEQFTGDIRTKIQEDISKASLVIADLSGNNPNVYLEIGYAWGREKKVLFIAREGETPTFDVAGHKTIRYSSENIKGLEDDIKKFLQAFGK